MACDQAALATTRIFPGPAKGPDALFALSIRMEKLYAADDPTGWAKVCRALWTEMVEPLRNPVDTATVCAV